MDRKVQLIVRSALWAILLSLTNTGTGIATWTTRVADDGLTTLDFREFFWDFITARANIVLWSRSVKFYFGLFFAMLRPTIMHLRAPHTRLIKV
jgi:hypothetical protein